MDFKETGSFIGRIISLIDRHDEIAREIITSFLPVIPEPYKTAVEWVLNTEKKTVAFLVDLIVDIEASGLKKDAKIKEAIKRCEDRDFGGLNNPGIAEVMIEGAVGIFDKIVKGK